MFHLSEKKCNFWVERRKKIENWEKTTANFKYLIEKTIQCDAAKKTIQPNLIFKWKIVGCWSSETLSSLFYLSSDNLNAHTLSMPMYTHARTKTHQHSSIHAHSSVSLALASAHTHTPNLPWKTVEIISIDHKCEATNERQCVCCCYSMRQMRVFTFHYPK